VLTHEPESVLNTDFFAGNVN